MKTMWRWALGVCTWIDDGSFFFLLNKLNSYRRSLLSNCIWQRHIINCRISLNFSFLFCSVLCNISCMLLAHWAAAGPSTPPPLVWCWIEKKKTKIKKFVNYKAKFSHFFVFSFGLFSRTPPSFFTLFFIGALNMANLSLSLPIRLPVVVHLCIFAVCPSRVIFFIHFLLLTLKRNSFRTWAGQS